MHFSNDIMELWLYRKYSVASRPLPQFPKLVQNMDLMLVVEQVLFLES